MEKSVSGGHWQIFTHADPTSTRAGDRGPRARQFIRFWASEAAEFTKICDSLPWTPMNRHENFDAASFILGGEIRNHTNKQTNKQTNSKRYIHTLPICM